MSFINNKRFQPYLIGFVVLLWVLIGYRIYTFLQPEELDDPIRIAKRPALESQQEETWKPALDYRDPFLKRIVQPKVETEATKEEPKKKKAEPIKKQQKLSAKIEYKGYIADDKKGGRLGLFSINGRSHLLGVGDVENELVVLQLSDTAAVVNELDIEFVIQLSP